MPSVSDKKSLLIILSVFLFIIIGTTTAITIARGYQLNIQNGLQFKATGLLSATSVPKGASVYINNRLITATDDTINLSPDDYQIKIIKDGFLPWQKTFQIKKEVVYQTNAQLFRSVPDIRPLTLSGALNPTISPDLSKIIFSVASASAQKDNGLYLIDVTDNLISLNRSSPRQLTPNLSWLDWSKARFTFSPNSRQVIASFSSPQINYLIQLDTPITSANLLDITLKLPQIKSEWDTQEQLIIKNRLERLPDQIKTLVSTDSAKNIAYNSTDDKVFYLASASALLDQNIITPPPAQSTQIQSRQIVGGNYYVYDLKEDTNFLIGSHDNLFNLNWIPNSNSLSFVENNQIQAIEYDATNKVTIYGGIFNNQIVFPWADGSKIITLITPYPGAPINLYGISLK